METLPVEIGSGIPVLRPEFSGIVKREGNICPKSNHNRSIQRVWTPKNAGGKPFIRAVFAEVYIMLWNTGAFSVENPVENVDKSLSRAFFPPYSFRMNMRLCQPSR